MMMASSDEVKGGAPSVQADLISETSKEAKGADAAFKYALEETVVYTDADNKRIRRMLDRRLIPWMFFTFSVQ
jgi:hypothetical protein